ncbi:MAG TPA: hypothetical protein VL576_01165 [Candidatus Paceibacterota bacterium]|jgi:hypothetical protein|nr:hypothetical protein [Candidatus Paceibacterota bacterium]
MEPQNSTTEKILAAIETSHITPRPKWYFVVRNILLWIPGLATTLLGAYAVSGILYGVIHAHLENRLYTSNLHQIASLIAIPIIWVFSFIIFSLITIAFLRKTNKGYRHPAVQLLSLSLACSVVIGILFYEVTASSLAGPGTLYRYPTQHQQQAIWNDPDDGRISGIITGLKGSVVSMTDFHGNNWAITVSTIPADEIKLLKMGNAIRVFGINGMDNTFTACRILQWELLPVENTPTQHILSTHPLATTCDSLLKGLPK